MTLTEFNQLSPEDQGIVAMSGSFVTDRRAGSQTVALYRLDDL